MEFSVKNKSLLIQNLVEIQQQSFNELLCVGLKRQLLQLNYIENKTRNLKLIFHAKNYKFVLPEITPKEAVLKAKSFASAIFVPVEYRTKKTVGIYWVLLGHLPFMTKRGHFIINGVPRVVLNQMVRSPGLYYKTTANIKNLSNDASFLSNDPSEHSYQQKEFVQNAPIFYSDIIPNRGTWLRLEIDRKKNIWVRMKRVDKIPMMLFLQALGYDLHRVEKLLYSRKFLNRDYLLNTDHPVNSNLALKKIKVEIEQQKVLKLAALEALNDDDPDIAKQLDYIEKTTTPTMGKEFLFQSFFNPASYDLSPLGRFQLNKKLNLSIPNDYTVLTEFDIFFATKELIKKASIMSNSDDIDHLQTRRIRSCGELLEIQLGEGIERLQKIIFDKISNTNLKRFSKPSKKQTIFNKDEKFKFLDIKKVDTDIKKVNKANLSKFSNINNLNASTQIHTYNCYFSKLPLVGGLRPLTAKNRFFKARGRSPLAPILKAADQIKDLPAKQEVAHLLIPTCSEGVRGLRPLTNANKSKVCHKHNLSLKNTSSYMDFLRMYLIKLYEIRFIGYKYLIRNRHLLIRNCRKDILNSIINSQQFADNKLHEGATNGRFVGEGASPPNSEGALPPNPNSNNILKICRSFGYNKRPASNNFLGWGAKPPRSTQKVVSSNKSIDLLPNLQFEEKNIYAKSKNCCQYNFDKKHKLQLGNKAPSNRSKKKFLKKTRYFSVNKFLKLVARGRSPLASIHNLITTNSINGALQELFGLNPLSQFMDQINPLSEITHKRRISSMGPGGVNRDNASMEVRSIHPTHYGRICPIETPEGHNAGLVNSPTLYARINNYGFLETPFFKVNSGQVQTKALYLTAQKEQQFKVSPPDLSCSELSFLPLGPTKMEGEVPMRKDFKFQRMVATQIEFIGVSPLQMISVATSLIPFLEHDDANRALMGSNMQRQAVPLLTAERPLVGTGLEGRVIADSSYIMQTKASGMISYVSNEVIIVQTFN